MFGERIKAARPTKAEIAERRWHYVAYDRLSLELHDVDPRTTGLVFVESTEKASRRDYHKRKLALLLSNERHFALECAALGYKILYVVSDRSFGDALAELGLRMTYLRPAERELREDLRGRAFLDEKPDPSWLSTIDDFRAACPRAPYRMERFYAHMRKKTGLLMERGRPIGDRFSFDEENRKRYRGEPRVPTRPRFLPDAITKEVLALVEERFPKHFGTLDGFAEPCSASDAKEAWAFARAELLPTFGPFEDAMSRAHPDLFHTKLSMLINLSRLVPRAILRDVASDFADGDLPIASAEGFIRQILGWREYVHHVHEATDGFRDPPLANALSANLPLPPAYWGTPSGMTCLDTVVGEVLRTGYSHHITRLMVLGNIATLAGFSARALSDWFWIAYVDAYDWVVEPNVLAMATYADGGGMTTKPYVSGAAYINKMSDYCGSCALDPKRSTGDGACPITALYWTFLDRNQRVLDGNQRIAMPLASVKKKTTDELVQLRRVAERAIDRLGKGLRVDSEN